MTKQGGWPATGFGARLRSLREDYGFSQSQLAIRAECRVETISRLEREEQEPAWPLVRALARALGVSCSAFETEAPAVGAEPPAEAPPRARGRPRKTEETTADVPAAKGKSRKRKD